MSDTHDHTHANPGTNRTRLAIAFGITATILIAEVIGAWWTNSLALLVDAGHMLTDASGLLMALIAASLALRPPTPERTWGYRRAEVLAAGAQSAILLAVGIYAFIEGVRRLFDPAEVTAGEMDGTFGRRTLDVRWAERFGDLGRQTTDRNEAERELARFPAGGALTVHYNPQDPSESMALE